MVRPTRNPLYEEAWKDYDNRQQNKSIAQIYRPIKPSAKYSSKYCYYCGKGWGKGRRRTRQHLLPKRRGGKYEIGNLRWCCFLCNQLLELVDDCPVVLNVYRLLIAQTPLRYLHKKTAFVIYIAMRNDRYNGYIRDLIISYAKQLKDKKKRCVARKILIYMKAAFPAAIRMYIPKEEMPIIFPKKQFLVT